MITLSMDEATHRARALAGRARCLLGITGCPGAGKSTLAAAVAAAVSSSVVVPMDGFHLANDELVRLGRRDRKGAPDTFDADAYAALLGQIRDQQRGQVVTAPRYDRTASASIPDAITIEADVALVITEGNYLLLDDGAWGRVRPLLDEVWYVELGDAIRVPRLIARHVEYGKSPAAAREWVMRSDEPNARLIAVSRSRANAVVHLS